MPETMKKNARRISLRHRHWCYRGEGNANLVLALSAERQIIRLRKSSPGDTNEDEEIRIWRETDFCHGVMLPLLSERFVKVPTVVKLSKMELEELNESLRVHRPKYRHHKGLYMEHAALFPDLCLLPYGTPFCSPVFCVEVKPKQGWIPIPDRRLKKCTFCLNQYSKLKNGSIEEVSEYCPLDLFSGCRSRMKRAIISLLVNPQNNLKMFKNGCLVHGDSNINDPAGILFDWFGSRDFEGFASLVVDALTYVLSEPGLEPSSEGTTGKSQRIPKRVLEEAESLLPGTTCYKEHGELPPGCILSRILQVQKLDQTGSDEVYYQYHRNPPSDDYAYVHELLRCPRNILKPVNSYLLATTAKDCSVLISFQKAREHGFLPVVRDSNEIPYAFNIGVSDLDPKPMSCIEKHRVRDLEVVSNCIEVLKR